MKTLRYLVMAVALGFTQVSNATTVTFDTGSARAIVSAIRNPSLTLDQATSVVSMTGNQGLLRELKGFDIPVSNQSFAKALYQAAHHQPITDEVERSYSLESVAANLDSIDALLDSIDRDPEHFQKAIGERIAQFAPKDADIHLQGYVVAGGDGGGYAFGGTDFYLNAGMIQDFVLARAVANHEMYHAVQGAFASARGGNTDNPDGSTCRATRKLFEDLYEEGTAAYVEDLSLVSKSNSPAGLRKRADMADGLRHIGWSSSLLDMSIDALTAHPPMAYESVYSVGFFGHGVLYSIGYVMAEDLVKDRGPSALVDLLKQPSYEFVLAYVRLPGYGKDAAHPLLGSATVHAAQALADGCN